VAAVASKAPAAVEPEKKKQDRAAAEDAGEAVVPRRPAAAGAEESARERLKRHRTDMAGRVRIPDMWGQERLLKDWVDCAVFDRPAGRLLDRLPRACMQLRSSQVLFFSFCPLLLLALSLLDDVITYTSSRISVGPNMNLIDNPIE